MAGFMAGFGTTLSNLIEEDRKYYRDTAAKRREYIQTYGTKAVVDREEKANAALSVANTLMSRGFSKNYVTNVASTNGISGLVSLASQLDDRTDLTKDDIKEIEASAKDFLKKDPEQDLTTIVNRAFGLYKSESDPVKRKTNIFASMLGMDAAMAEDEVLNDMYVNGFTGRDIYRIMGSSGPKAGEPLDVTLPPKAPSPTTLATITTTLSDKYNDILDGLILQATSAQDVVKRQELEALKASGLAGMATLATSNKYPEGKYLLEIAKQMEKSQAGLITDNFNLPVTFREEYKTYVSDKADDAKMTEAEDKGKGTTPPETGKVVPTPTETYKFENKEEFNTAASTGAIAPNAQVKIGDMPAQTFNAPEGYVYTPSEDVKTVVTTPTAPVAPSVESVLSPTRSGVDLKDGTVEQYRRYENMYKGLMELPEDQRSDYLDAFDSLENIPSIKDAVEVIIEDAPAAADALGGYAYGGTGYGVSLFTEGMATVYAALTGDTATAAKVKANTIRNRKEMKEVMANGIVDHLQKIVDDNDIKGGFGPDRAKAVKRAVLENKPLMNAVDAMVTKNANGALEANPENPMVKAITGMLIGDGNAIPAEEVSKVEEAEPDYAAAAMRAKDHLETLGEQAKSVAKDLSSAISKAVGKAQTTSQEARTAKAALQEQGVTTEGMSERETIEAYDRQFISDWKNMPVALKTIVLGSMVDKNKGMTEEETIRDLDRQFIMDWEGMPVQNKTIIRDVLYGKRVESFTDEQNKRLNEMRQTNPDWFIDTAPSGLSAATPSEVETTFKSRPDRGPGIMSRMNPTETKQVDLEGAPKIGDVEFENMLERVHGGKSDIVMNFRKKITEGLKAADVTRLIKSTQGLPKTKSRDTLLMSLYDLRDALNKR